MNIKLTSIFVHDPVTAHQYYTEILGFQSFMFMPEARMAIIVSPEDPAGTALLLEPNENPIAKTYQESLYKANIPVMVFGTKDMDAEYEKLQAKGVVFRSTPVKNDWGSEVVLEDTCGNLIKIHQS